MVAALVVSAGEGCIKVLVGDGGDGSIGEVDSFERWSA